MSKHKDFILTNYTEVIENTVNVSRGISMSIGSYGICEYVFQTLFLKLTGASEQKMKCLCWEMGTEDYDFRRDYLENNGKYGEMSNYDSKKYVYQNLVKIIKKSEDVFNVSAFIDKSIILPEVKTFILNTFNDTMLCSWNIRDYNNFGELFDKVFLPEFVARNDNELLAGNLFNAYDKLYSHRNRCAHNLLSYQQNLPSLRELSSDDYKYENYYIRFALLMVIDRVFIELYKKFIS